MQGLSQLFHQTASTSNYQVWSIYARWYRIFNKYIKKITAATLVCWTFSNILVKLFHSIWMAMKLQWVTRHSIFIGPLG